MVELSVDVHPVLPPPLLNVRSLLEGEKKRTRLGLNRESLHTSTLLEAGARRANPEQKFRESDLYFSYQTAERMALAAKPPAFCPDRQGDLLQQ